MSYIGKAPGFGIRNRYYYTATAAQTTFSGADDNGQTLAYADSKYLDVYLNGVLLVAGTDYTATTLTSVTLTSGASASDIIEIVAYDIFSVADTVSAANGGTFSGNITIDGDLTASSIAYPTADGTSGQVITTNGSGTLSFTTIASDKIEEGNSSVEVVDTGTGYVAVTVDGTETARFVAGGNFNFNSGYGSVATAYGCRAWVNFNGTGTVAIRESGNVSSITDNGTGNYTVNFTTAMPDANYSVVGSFAWGNNGNQFLPDSLATSTCGVLVLAGNTFYDSNQVNVAIFR